MLKEYDVVELITDLNEWLKVGVQGTIVMMYPGQNKVFEVEFVAEDGHTIEVTSARADQVKLVWSAPE